MMLHAHEVTGRFALAGKSRARLRLQYAPR